MSVEIFLAVLKLWGRSSEGLGFSEWGNNDSLTTFWLLRVPLEAGVFLKTGVLLTAYSFFSKTWYNIWIVDSLALDNLMGCSDTMTYLKPYVLDL